MNILTIIHCALSRSRNDARIIVNSWFGFFQVAVPISVPVDEEDAGSIECAEALAVPRREHSGLLRDNSASPVEVVLKAVKL